MTMRYIESENGLGPFLDGSDKAKVGLARILVTAAKAWREAYGDIPLPSQVVPTQETSVKVADLFSKVYPEISLPEEHQRQGLILAGRYARNLGFESAEAYIATLPQFPEKPSNYSALGLNIPIIVETRVPWMEAAELSGISVTNYLKGRADVGEVSDWPDDEFEMPEAPFSAWAQDGTKFVYRKPADVRKELLSERENRDYRAGRILDSITIWNVRPDMVKAMYWDIIGTKVGSARVPYLRGWLGEPRLHADLVGFAVPVCRALVLGREIRTLSLAA